MNPIMFEDYKAMSKLLSSSKYVRYASFKFIHVCGSIFVTAPDLRSKCNSERLSIVSVLRVNTLLKELKIGSCSIQSSDSVHLPILTIIIPVLNEKVHLRFLSYFRLWDTLV